MKAVIENRGGLYLIRLYGSDGMPCDTFVVEDLFFEGIKVHKLLEKGFGGDSMKIYDLLWKRNEDKNGKTRWERVGILMDKDSGKMSVKIDLIPVGQWDGWLVVSERREKEEPF